MHDLMRIFKALSNETRIRILKLLLECESLCVCEVMQALDIPETRASRNLGILRDAGFLRDERKGLWIHYSIDKEIINEYCKPMLVLLRGWLNDNKVVVKDKKRLDKVVKLE